MKRGGGGRKVKCYFCRRRQACGGWMAESITQFELQNDETSDPRREQDDQTLRRRKRVEN